MTKSWDEEMRNRLQAILKEKSNFNIKQKDEFSNQGKILNLL